ncbi:probable methyltransferase PMT2 [Durio zibethinus]|uniref:Methyltransferase n=1 Tax=Durio zibethinus TaxID=66656 RepID=A0A6P5Y8W9_DURZI|nr:probable methyltransferase PMT2 [Durio zibethinus]XP_022736815.1 probable methyltransferase PMT2 [Durio zibethinus]XP_022736816.1 probable methyltransferase PMT2 [Durio zibethinus]
MATKGNAGELKTRGSVSIFIVVGLCCFFYILGAWQRSGFGKGDKIASAITRQTDCSVLSNLNYETHLGGDAVTVDGSDSAAKEFQPCDDKYSDYTPCQDQMRAMTFPRENMIYRERHCPPEEEKLHCLIPAPKGYATPFPWPKSRDYVPYANAPYKSLTVEKAVQNWIQYEGNVFRFPGGGTQFPQGADRYINQLASVIPIDNGMVRTALDTGCGVASLGAYLFKKNVLTMSFAPRDSHEAQVQFALERGVPAVIGVLGTIKMPYPSRAFDMAHCSRCLIPWGANDGMYMMEVDRVLRPGGYWVLSGPPINWRNNYQAWQRPREELEEEQRKIEETAKLLCWEKKHEMGEISVWRKRTNYDSCHQQDTKPTLCESRNPDDVWYKKMEVCATPYPETTGPDEVAVGDWKQFPERLNAVPFRISSGSVPGVSVEMYHKDVRLWKKHVKAYKSISNIIDSGRYRNIMDMNAGLGSFAAALESQKLWVMNVMPTIAEKDTLGVIYERGLIGIYHDWCEAFSTYPRTYDLIHANSIFSLYKNICKAEDILLEMDRILRPEGTVIIRDQVDVLNKVKKIVGLMRWNTRMVDHEDGPLVSEKILFAVKKYWVAGENDTTSLE